jgi:hypothetical protein
MVSISTISNYNRASYVFSILSKFPLPILLFINSTISLKLAPTATIDDGSCDFASCLGCTYQYAVEYDSTATIDDGSCSENTPCPGDFSGDSFVNVSDLGGFLGAFGSDCE